MTRQTLNAFVLFLLLMVAPLPFLPEFGGANSSTRLMLTNALVEDGTTRIDRYADLTIDKAQVGDHFYSDKAPGMALLAIPAYTIGRALAPTGAEALFRLDEPLDTLPLASMVIWRTFTWTTAGLLMALAGVALYRMGQRLGVSPRAALMGSLSVCLATPMLGWSAQFFGHVGAGAALVIAFALSTGIGRAETLLSAPWRAIAAGAALSLAVSIEYTAAPPALIIVFYAVWRLTSIPAPTAWRLFAFALAAAIGAALPMLVYHWASFGSPFRVGYSSVVGFEGMEKGLLGLTLPDPEVLRKIIFGFRRGIIWLSPLLLLMPWGLWMGLRKPGRGAAPIRIEMLLCLAVIVYYYLLNASYFYWGGGASLGPRHTLPALAFMGLPFMLLWDQLGGLAKRLLQALFGLSVFLSLASASINMTTTRGWFPIIDPILKTLFTDQNVFMRMANWGLSPALVFGVWAIASVSLTAVLLRGTSDR